MAAHLGIGVLLGQLGQRRHRRLVLELAERVGALHAHARLGLPERGAQERLRVLADGVVVERLVHRRRGWGRRCGRRWRRRRRRGRLRRSLLRLPDRDAADREPGHRDRADHGRARALAARLAGGHRDRGGRGSGRGRGHARRPHAAQRLGLLRPLVPVHVVQIGEHVGRAVVAAGRVLHEHPIDDLGDRRGHAQDRRHLGEPRRLPEQVAGHDRLQRVADERRDAGEHLVRDHAQRVDIGAVVDVPRAVDLLGRHVVRRADHRAGLGQLLARALGPDELRDPEVEQLHLDAAVDVLEPDVVGLEIAVDEALVVRRLERAQRLLEDRERLGPRQRAPADPRRQRLAFEVLHHEEHAAEGIAAEVVDVDDVLVPDRVDRARLLVEALDDVLRAAELELEHLDRAAAADLAVLALEHHAHPALGQLALDHVAAQLLADEQVGVGAGAGERLAGVGCGAGRHAGGGARPHPDGGRRGHRHDRRLVGAVARRCARRDDRRLLGAVARRRARRRARWHARRLRGAATGGRDLGMTGAMVPIIVRFFFSSLIGSLTARGAPPRRSCGHRDPDRRSRASAIAPVCAAASDASIPQIAIASLRSSASGLARPRPTQASARLSPSRRAPPPRPPAARAPRRPPSRASCSRALASPARASSSAAPTERAASGWASSPSSSLRARASPSFTSPPAARRHGSRPAGVASRISASAARPASSPASASASAAVSRIPGSSVARFRIGRASLSPRRRSTAASSTLSLSPDSASASRTFGAASGRASSPSARAALTRTSGGPLSAR